MIPVCTWCAQEINRGNRRWPGYDDPSCRASHAAWLDQQRVLSRQARRAARLAASVAS